HRHAAAQRIPARVLDAERAEHSRGDTAARAVACETGCFTIAPICPRPRETCSSLTNARAGVYARPLRKVNSLSFRHAHFRAAMETCRNVEPCPSLVGIRGSGTDRVCIPDRPAARNGSTTDRPALTARPGAAARAQQRRAELDERRRQLRDRRAHLRLHA